MTTDANPCAAITGASGYLGGLLWERLEQSGFRTVGLVRNATQSNSRRYVLGREPDPDLLRDVDVLVHCAYDMTLTRADDIRRTNVDGTDALLRLARDSGVRRTVYVSSMSAYEGTTQLYGRSKLESELIAQTFGCVTVRPGLVYGPGVGGMAGALQKATRLPIVPVPAARSFQYTVLEDDFVDAIAALVKADTVISEPIGIANPIPVTFQRLIEGLARTNCTACTVVPIPWQPIYRALRLIERLPVTLPFRADSLLGLARPAPGVPNLDFLASLGVSLRRFGQPVPPGAALNPLEHP